MAQADRLAIESGIAGIDLMDNAGRAVARAIRARLSPCRTLVLCGPGNNGGDGYVTARLLAQAGWPVTVAATGSPRRGSDAALAAARWRGPRVRFGARAVQRAALVVDAVYGAGLSREVDGVTAETLRAARRLVAVDVPSGLDGASGAVRGFAPQAALTVTFFRRKPGHLLYPGRALCGELVLADIGIPPGVLGRTGVDTFANGPGLFSLPRLDADAHKYTRGTVTVCAGAMGGAARLAAFAARRGGAGLVTIAAEGEAHAYDGIEPGTIVSPAPLETLLEDARRQVWICGPGLGQERARRLLPLLLRAERTVLADADALSACAGRPEALRGAAILTPHDGEFTKFFGEIGPDRLAACRAAAKRVGAVVVLKGPDTVIAAPDGRAAINENAPPWLATAGTGDVLSGLAAALLAQGLPPFEAACAAVWVHGEAGTIAGEGMVVEDLLPAIAQALRAGHSGPGAP